MERLHITNPVQFLNTRVTTLVKQMWVMTTAEMLSAPVIMTAEKPWHYLFIWDIVITSRRRELQLCLLVAEDFVRSSAVSLYELFQVKYKIELKCLRTKIVTVNRSSCPNHTVYNTLIRIRSSKQAWTSCVFVVPMYTNVILKCTAQQLFPLGKHLLSQASTAYASHSWNTLWKPLAAWFTQSSTSPKKIFTTTRHFPSLAALKIQPAMVVI